MAKKNEDPDWMKKGKKDAEEKAEAKKEETKRIVEEALKKEKE